MTLENVVTPGSPRNEWLPSPAPTLPAIASPGPCLTGSPCHINGQYLVPWADLRSPWSWGPERSPLHPSSADTELQDTHSSPPWNSDPPDSGSGMASVCSSVFPKPLGLVQGWSLPGRQPGPSRTPSLRQAPPAPGAAGRSPHGCSCWGPVGSSHPHSAELHLELLPEKRPTRTQPCSAVSPSPIQAQR